MNNDNERFFDGENEERVELTPSPRGERCLGNGKHADIECRCEECDFYGICFPLDPENSRRLRQKLRDRRKSRCTL